MHFHESSHLLTHLLLKDVQYCRSSSLGSRVGAGPASFTVFLHYAPIPRNCASNVPLSAHPSPCKGLTQLLRAPITHYIHHPCRPLQCQLHAYSVRGTVINKRVQWLRHKPCLPEIPVLWGSQTYKLLEYKAISTITEVLSPKSHRDNPQA